MQTSEKSRLGLYLHIPFCVRKCAYCDFYSFSTSVASESEATDIRQNYVNKLIEQLFAAHNFCSAYEVDTVYFGGGTPSLLSSKMYDGILNAISQHFNIAQNAEITTECNPGTIESNFLKDIRKSGINRLSIGAQSMNDNELKLLGRMHSVNDFIKAYTRARAAGFDNISVDLMYGIPDSTKESFLHSIEQLCKLSPEHISSYALTIEEGTPFAAIADTLDLPDEDMTCEMYLTLIDRLENSGYEQYEISNFSKKGMESKHNLGYWLGKSYLGFGAASHSYFDNCRFSAVKNVERYVNYNFSTIKNASEFMKNDITADCQLINEHDRMSEYIMLRLRLNSGLDLIDFKSRFNIDFSSFISHDLSYYIKNGYMTLSENKLKFTVKGFFVSNYILSDILEFEGI